MEKPRKGEGDGWMRIDQRGPRKSMFLSEKERKIGSEHSRVVPALHSGEVHLPLRKECRTIGRLRARLLHDGKSLPCDLSCE